MAHTSPNADNHVVENIFCETLLGTEDTASVCFFIQN